MRRRPRKRIGSAVVGQRTLSSGTIASNVEVLAHHSRSRRTTETILQESMLDLPRKDGDTMGFERTRRAPPRVNLRRGRVRHSRQLPTRMMMMQSSENLKHAKRLQWRGQGLPHRVCPFQVVARMEHPGEKRRGPRKRRSPRRRRRTAKRRIRNGNETAARAPTAAMIATAQTTAAGGGRAAWSPARRLRRERIKNPKTRMTRGASPRVKTSTWIPYPRRTTS
mmetsp:Transcript_7424/g.32747  ORF Transcript_7424/g.32747 Transcript_7424/m.32747 type:complete len:223 (+) Transcript_7424:398-1066(+)